jgi:hypothetical protein
MCNDFRIWLIAGAILGTNQACWAQVPPGLEEPKLVRNGFSGDRRIQIRRFHAITLFDTASFGRAATNGRQQLEIVLRSFSRDLRKEAEGVVDASEPFFDVAPRPYRLEGSTATWENFDELITNLADPTSEDGVKADDVVFFWSLTHGDVGADGKPTLVLGGTARSRDALRKQMEFPQGGKRRTYLTVFVTEVCDERLQANNAPGPAEHDGNVVEPAQPARIWRSLYFGHKGTVDIASSDKGQKSFLLNGKSVFVDAFRRTFDQLITDKKALQRSADDGMVEWDGKFFPRLRDESQGVVRKLLARYFVVDSAGKVQLDASGAATPTAEFNSLTDEDKQNLRKLAAQGAQDPVFNAALPLRLNEPRPR